MATQDKISEVNKLCQKNSLSFDFLKIKERNSIDINYVIKLRIKNPKTAKFVDYYGQALLVQSAKHKAAIKAISDNFVSKLVNQINTKSSNLSNVSKVNPLPNANSKINKSINSSSINRSSQILNKTFNTNEDLNKNHNKVDYLRCDVRSFQQAIAQSTIIPKPLPNNNLIIKYDKNLEPNYVYESYLIAKKFNLNISIQMINNLSDKITIKFKIGDKSALGTSTSEYEAMQIAAREFNSNMFSINDNNQIQDTIYDNSNVYLTQLNEIHLKLNESLDLKSILFIDKLKDPLSIYKAQLGKLICFGIGSTAKEAQNDAAKKLLKSFKIKLDHELSDLEKESAKLQIKKLKLIKILDIYDRFDAKIMNKKRRSADDSNDIRMDVDEYDNNSELSYK